MTDEELRATMQDIYNRVCEHLVKQGKQAVDRNDTEYPNNCMYRTPDGLMCAAGCLIGDEHYDPSFEGATVDADPVEEALFKSGIPNNREVLLLIWRMQHAHDARLDKFKDNLESLCDLSEDYELQIPQCLTDALK